MKAAAHHTLQKNCGSLRIPRSMTHLNQGPLLHAEGTQHAVLVRSGLHIPKQQRVNEQNAQQRHQEHDGREYVVQEQADEVCGLLQAYV